MLKCTVKILSFDPGLTCTGWALTEYNTTTGKAFVSKRGKIEGKRALNKYKEKLVLFNKSYIQLTHLEEELFNLMRYKPDYVVTESAFWQPGRTAAYAALVLCIHTIERVIGTNLGLPVFKLAPQCIKRIVTDHGQASKITVQEAILLNPDIELKETKQNPIEKMVEHEADAIACAWAFIKCDLPSIIV
jgi:Holliday junction resolvasome RuvABC endonuclease subunit